MQRTWRRNQSKRHTAKPDRRKARRATAIVSTAGARPSRSDTTNGILDRPHRRNTTPSVCDKTGAEISPGPPMFIIITVNRSLWLRVLWAVCESGDPGSSTTARFQWWNLILCLKCRAYAHREAFGVSLWPTNQAIPPLESDRRQRSKRRFMLSLPCFFPDNLERT